MATRTPEQQEARRQREALRTFSPEEREHRRTYQREYMRKLRLNPDALAKAASQRKARVASDEVYAEKLRNEAAARGKKRRAALSLLLIDAKSVGCRDCQETDHRCLDFHHTGHEEKDMAISRLRSRSVSDARMRLELQKCVVLCSNCHRKLHSRSRV